MAVNIFLTSFLLSIMALSISLNFRISKFLNLSLGGVFASGAYIAYFHQNPAIPAVLGFLTGFFLAYYILKVCRSVIEATIVSLGAGLLIERILEVIHRGSYYYIIHSNSSHLIIFLGALFFIAVAFSYLSPIGLKLKYIESDIELAEMYGVDTERFVLIVTSLTTSAVMLSGFFYAEKLAISPSIGFGYLISGIIVSAISAQLNLKGIAHYTLVFILSFLFTAITGVLV